MISSASRRCGCTDRRPDGGGPGVPSRFPILHSLQVAMPSLVRGRPLPSSAIRDASIEADEPAGQRHGLSLPGGVDAASAHIPG